MQMDERVPWGPRRYFTFLVVLLTHLGVLTAWMLGSRSFRVAIDAPAKPLYVKYFPASPQPKQVAAVLPRRLSGDLKDWIAPVTLQAPSLPPVSTAPEGGAGGSGAGPDWNAEARRAVQAYEIRGRLGPPENLLSGSPGDERWWRRAPHKAGDRYKTPSGDWVVWINPNCYQVATAAARSTSNAVMPDTVCPDDLKNQR
jgi:hypothetical protein